MLAVAPPSLAIAQVPPDAQEALKGADPTKKCTVRLGGVEVSSKGFEL